MKSHILSFSKFRNILSINEAISVEDWYNKFQNSFGNVTLQIVKDIVKADPTSKNGEFKGLYSQWLINLYKKNNLKLEDLYKAEEYLRIFDKVKSKLPNKDISFYKTLPDLFKVIEPYKENKELTLSNREKIGKTKVDDEVELFYEDEFIKVEIPLTYRASCALGSGTEWCTATGKTDEYFKHYTKDGAKLYVIFDKDQNAKYQFSFVEKQFMDENDEELESFSFLENSPKFFQKLKNIESNLYVFVEFIMKNLNSSNVKIIKSCQGLFSSHMLTYLLNNLFFEVTESDSFTPQEKVFEIMDFFIKDGANLNYFSEDDYRPKTAYLYPIIDRLISKKFNYLENKIYLEKFLEYKPDVNIRYGGHKNTPLMTASKDRLQSIAELLLKAGADPNLKNTQGYNSAFIAINTFNPRSELTCNKYIALLKQYGLNMKDTNKEGLNILEFYVKKFYFGDEKQAEKFTDFIKLKELYNS